MARDFDVDSDDMSENARSGATSAGFDHLFCHDCNACLIFQKYVPIFEAARQIGCQDGHMRIWATPCTKCRGEMDLIFIPNISKTNSMICCQNRFKKPKRLALEKDSWINTNFYFHILCDSDMRQA